MKNKALAVNTQRSKQLTKIYLEAYKGVNSGVMNTAFWFIVHYCMHVNRHLANGGLITNLPLFYTNNPAIAYALNCSKRTVPRHRKRLEQFGFFVPVGVVDGKAIFSKFRGNYADYAVKINPDLLYLNIKGHPGNRIAIPGGGYDKMSPTSIKNTNLEQLRTEVDKKSTHDKNVSPGGDNHQLQRTDNEPFVTENERAIYAPYSSDDLDRNRLLRREAKKVWRHAKFKFWRNRYFSNRQESAILHNIAGLFGSARPEVFGKIVANYQSRINLIADHWPGDLPDPLVFFDPLNESGFRSTKSWLNQPERYPPSGRSRISLAENVSEPTLIGNFIAKNQ